MQIHTVKQGEHVADIAKEYGICEQSIRRCNGIDSGECAEGEELLILVPTRTYSAKRGDSLDRISLRFNVKASDIIAMNPHLATRALTVGEKITLRSSERPLGTAVANGYFYRECPIDRLKLMLPYLTYVTFGSYAADSLGIRRLFDDSVAKSLATAANKIPLVRIFDSFPIRYESKVAAERFADEVIRLAINGGYKGVVINCPKGASDGAFAEFIVKMRGKMMGNDLILLTEVDKDSPISYSDYADGSILSYHKYAEADGESFDKGERAVLSGFACKGESAKALVELPCLAKCGEKFATSDEIIAEARRVDGKIKNDEESKISSFFGKAGEWKFASLNAIRSIYELIGEYDYSGVSFDVMRVPITHVMMYNACFKTAYNTSVRTREGCSREA